MNIFYRSVVFSLILAFFWVTPTYAGDPFKKGMTIKLAYAIPQGGFGENMPLNPFNNRYTLNTMNSGIGLQLGTMYFLNFIDLGDKMALGIDVTWLSTTYQIGNYDFVRNYVDENINYTDAGEFDMYYLYFSAEAGPSFSFSPNEKLAFDLSFKLSPTFALSGGDYPLESIGDSERLGASAFGLRYCPAFYFRYSLLMLGVEYNMGDLDLQYKTTGIIELTESQVSMPFDGLRLILGVKF
ncbi:MAG: hypothetical protein RH916_07400 [Vicingaceae bacterium]